VKAILCQRFGAPDDLVLADVPEPVAGPGEVVAKVAAVGLNFFDTLIIAGKYQTKPPFPFSPGGELAGVVESVASGVTALKPFKVDHLFAMLMHLSPEKVSLRSNIYSLLPRISKMLQTLICCAKRLWKLWLLVARLIGDQKRSLVKKSVRRQISWQCFAH